MRKKLTEKQEKFIDEYFWSGNATEAAKKAEYKGAPFATGYRNLKNETIINELEAKIKENLEFDLMFINGFLARYKTYLLSETNIKSKVRTRTKVLKNVSDLKKEINWLEEIQKG